MLRGAAALGGAALLSPTARLLAAAGEGKSGDRGYGPLAPVRDGNTGLPLIALPAGFRYITLGWVGEPLADGTRTPGSHDGMGVVGERDGVVTVVRNHELVTDLGAFGPREIQYDPVAGGGTTTFEFDTRTGRQVRAWPSLAGTVQNCAGGTTPWGTWLSCEEFVHERRGDARAVDPARRLQREHGFVFEVHPGGTRNPQPLEGLGQFRHEAAVVHAASGNVYLTEDRTPRAGFYRFLPTRRGELAAGGRLQMLRAVGRKDLRRGLKTGQSFRVRWVEIEAPHQGHTPGTLDGLGVLAQGLAADGSVFTRGEGCFATSDAIYFTCTDGGDAACGQVFAYYPAQERLALVYESPDRRTMDYPDNICFSPRGGMVLCEDGDRQATLIHGMSAGGDLFPFARNNVRLDGTPRGLRGDFRDSEWAGCCFTPDGKWLFANVFTPGFTVAITGPWRAGLI